MTDTKPPSAQPPVAKPSEMEDTHRQFTKAMRSLTTMQRQYIRDLPHHRFQRWGVARTKHGLSTNTIWKWLRKPVFLQALELQQQISETANDLSRGRLLNEIEAIGFSNAHEYVDEAGRPLPIHKLSTRAAAAVMEWETGEDGQVYARKLQPKKDALATVERIHNLAPQRHEFTGKDGAPLMAPSDPVDLARRVAYLLAAGAHAADSRATTTTPTT